MFAAHRVALPGTAELLWSVEFRLMLTWWIHADRRARGFGVPYEFDAFVLFVWPFAVPYYLYRTRGGKGLLFAAGIGGLFVLPPIVATIISIAAGH